MKIIYAIYNFLLTENMRQIRFDVFVGVSAIIIAIVIFVAEVLSDDKEADQAVKETIVSSTYLKPIVISMLIIFGLLWVEEISSKCFVFYIFYQFGLDIYIIVISVLTGISIFKTIRFLTDDEFKNNKVYDYCNNKLSLNNRKLDIKTIDINKNKFEQYIKENKNEIIINNDDDIYLKGYVEVKANKRGLIVNYNTKAFDKMHKKIKVTSKLGKVINNVNNVSKLPYIILTKRIGDYVQKNETIGFYNENIIDDKNIITNALQLSDFVEYDSKTIKIINKHYFIEAIKSKIEFDANNYFIDYINKLYKANNRKAIGILVEDIYDFLYENSQYSKNLSFNRFLWSFIIISFENKDNNTFNQLLDIANDNYANIIINSNNDKENNIEDNTHSYESFYSHIYYSINEDSKCYEQLLSCLVKTIYKLIKECKIEPISTLIERCFMRKAYNNQKNENLSLDRQFIYAIINVISIITKYNTDMFNSNKESFLNTIYSLHNVDYGIYTINEFVDDYLKNINTKGVINSIRERADFLIYEHKNDWSWDSKYISNGELLLNTISVYKIMYYDKSEILVRNIKTENEYFYKQLRDSIKNYQDNSFVNELNIPYITDKIQEYVEDVLNTINEIKKEKIRSTKISEKKLIKIAKEIQKVVNIEDILQKRLKKIGKVKETKRKTKNGAYINQLIPKEFLSKDVANGEQALIDGYKYSVTHFIFKKYINEINNIESNKRISIKDYINNIKNKEEYTVFIKDYKEKYEDKLHQLSCIISDNLNESFVIANKDLPIIELCNPEDVDEKDIIDKTYISLADLSSSEEKRNEIIDSNYNFKEIKTVEDKHDHLKEFLLLNAFYPFEILNVDNN